MTEIQNPKQKNNYFELVLNLYFVFWNLFVIWCLGFVILDSKLQGRAGEL